MLIIYLYFYYSYLIDWSYPRVIDMSKELDKLIKKSERILNEINDIKVTFDNLDEVNKKIADYIQSVLDVEEYKLIFGTGDLDIKLVGICNA